MSVDSTTLAVLQGGLERVVEEMDITLRRAAFSPGVSEACDMANGIYESSNGDVVCQGPKGVLIFISVMQATTQAIIQQWGDTIQPGDVFIVNDPFTAGTHLQDFKLVAPYFSNGRRVAFLANTAHWIDVGGAVPGGFGIEAREIFQEGVRVPAVKLVDAGKMNEALLKTIMANVRVPTWAYGDLMAMLSALVVGERHLDELVGRFGVETILEAIAELKRRTEAHMRQCIKGIPDGVYTFEDFNDGDGVSNQPLRIRASLEVRGTEMWLDFTGSDPQSPGPMNLPYSIAYSGIHVAIKHIFSDVPMNAGSFVPVKVILPAGSLVNPERGCAVGGYSEVCLRVMDVVAGLFAQAVPELVPAASASTLNALLVGGVDPETQRRYVCFLFTGGGGGGSARLDGLSHMNPQVGAARSQPAEILEHRYPILFDCWRLRQDSGGRGRYRGGCGAEYSMRLLRGAARATSLGDRSTHRPYGLQGGEPGQGTELVYIQNGKEFSPPLVNKIQDVPLQEGDRIILRTPGGGGYGPPDQRAAAAIDSDVRRGFVSAAPEKQE